MANSRAIPGNEREVGGGEKQHSVLVGWALLFAYYSIIAGAPKQIIEVDPALWQWGGHVTYRILAPEVGCLFD